MFTTTSNEKTTGLYKPNFRKLKKYLAGLLIGIAATAVLVCICALVLTLTPIPDSGITVFAYAAVFIGAFLTGFTTVLFVRTNGLVNGLIAGALFFIIQLIVGITVTGEVGMTVFIFLAIDLIAGAIGGIAGVNVRR